MNIFNKYGIKEVADVTFYSITRIEDEEFYTPVLFFDTLKVSTLNKSVETVNANAGKGNGKVLSWNFGKDLKLKLEDALFSDASLDMYMNGRIQSKMSDWTSAIAKLSVANKYGRKHYSTKAYGSPQLTDKEWNIVFQCAQEIGYKVGETETSAIYIRVSDNDPYVAENRKTLVERYYQRKQLGTNDEIGFPKINLAMPQCIINHIIEKIDEIKKLGRFQNDLYASKAIDRFEKCIVTSKEGFTIDAATQKANLLKYYADDRSSSFTVFFDAKTMLPLFSATGDGIFNEEKFTLKHGTIYYKWSRTVAQFDNPNTMLGTDLIINAEIFPAEYRIVGETYVREQKTGKDQRMQFVLKRAKISPSTNIELKADGGPTTFSVDVDVLMPKDKQMLELRMFDVEEDKREGGFKIVPQNKRHSYTPTNQGYIDSVIDNNEIY